MTQGWLAPGMGVGEPALLLADAEVGSLEQFGRQDDLGAAGGGLADQARDRGDVGVRIVAEAGLQRRDADRPRAHAGTCWLMQWNEPPPVRSAVEGRAMTARSGNRVSSAWTANLEATSS